MRRKLHIFTILYKAMRTVFISYLFGDKYIIYSQRHYVSI